MNTDVLIKPVISEKSLKLAQSGWFTFVVKTEATKDQIRKTVGNQFKVTVVKIRTAIKKGMTRRVGKKRTEIVLTPIKKAFVKLKDKQTISLFDVVNQT